MVPALIVVDFQRDFCPGGSLPNDKALEIIPAVNDFLCFFMERNLPVIYTMDWHPVSTPHFDKWPVHCVQGTDGASMHPGIIYPDDYYPMALVRKGMGQDDGYSGFSTPADVKLFGRDSVETMPDMKTLLTALNVTDIIIVGLLFDYCVGETAFDAAKLGYNVTIPAHGTAGNAMDTSMVMGDKLIAVGVNLTAKRQS